MPASAAPKRPRDPNQLAKSITDVEKINAPFLSAHKASGPEFGAGIKHAVERGWLELHESGTYVRLINRDRQLVQPYG